MRWLLASLCLILLILQYRLWFGEGSLAHKSELAREIEKQQARNERLVERNRVLAEEVEGLRMSPDAIEERARSDLGMIKQDETFFLVLDKKQRPKPEPPPDPKPVPEAEARDAVPEELFE